MPQTTPTTNPTPPPTTPPTIHYPRPAMVANAYGFREFGSSEPLPLTGGGALATVCVYRSGNCNVALLRVDIDYGTAVFGVSATPTELRELAARLMDAAHDIEAHPAATLAAVASKGGVA